MKNRLIKYSRYFIFILICIVTIGGVSATWHFVGGSNSTITSININQLELFNWSEYLPNVEGGTAEETTNKIIEGPFGLNDPSSTVSEAIRLQKIFGHDSFSSVDIWRQHKMKKELGLDDKTNFLIEFPNDTTRIIYTTTVIIGRRATLTTPEVCYFPKEEYIYPIYRTVSKLDEKTNKWLIGSTKIGAAKPGYYKNSLIITSIDTPLFNPQTWVAGYFGQNLEQAIYAYPGQFVDAVVTVDSPIYYKYITNNNTTTLTLENKGSLALIEILTASGIKIYPKVSESRQKKYFSWDTQPGEIYFIKISSNINELFKIS